KPFSFSAVCKPATFGSGWGPSVEAALATGTAIDTAVSASANARDSMRGRFDNERGFPPRVAAAGFYTWLLHPAFHREGEGEGRAVPELGLDPDAPAVQLDQPLGQRESETGALALLRADVGLLELFEDAFLVLGRDPGTGVSHRHEHLPVLPGGCDVDAS